MELLNTLEPVSRGAYTGSLGYIDAASGRMDLNILIRSLFLEETGAPFVYNGAIHVGAGIVADSVPDELEVLATTADGTVDFRILRNPNCGDRNLLPTIEEEEEEEEEEGEG